MALNFRQSFGNKAPLPEFREGSGMVQGLQSVGATSQQQSQGSDFSYMDVNKFENNWEDLDEDFSKQETLDIKHEIPSQEDNVRHRSSMGTKPSIKSSGLRRTYYDEPAVIRHEQFDRKHRSTIEIRHSSLVKRNDTTEITSSDENFILKPKSSVDDHEVQDYPSYHELSPVDTTDINVEHAGLRKRSYQTEAARTFNQIFVSVDRSDAGGNIGCCGFILWFLSILLIIITFPFSLCLSIKVVQEYERAVIFRLGRLVSGGAKGPGLFFIIPCIDSYTKVDMRTVSFDVPPQEVLTKDSVTVAVDAVVYYRIQNATMSITNVEDSNRSTRLLAATTLRNVLGTKNLSEILSDRESISHVMQTSLDDATDPWGVKVERVEVKDVRLPVQLQRAMAAEAEAAREARAKVIAAEGEQKASRALKEAADVMAESPAAIQLRYLQTLNTISAEKNSTIIFPLPVDLMQAFMRKSGSAGESAQSHF